MQFDPKAFRDRVLAGERLAGTWLGMGSSIAAEVAAHSGLDWVLVDTEHGIGEHEALVPQLQAVSGHDCAGIVRVSDNDPTRFKRVLDLGANGVMVPWIRSVEEAEAVVSATRYPPRGIRGAASITRATSYGNRPFAEALSRAHEETLVIIQIERREALDSVEEIAAVEGVDVLFVGPLDLSVSMAIPQQVDEPVFNEALERVAAAAKAHGKAAGILVMDAMQLAKVKGMGYSFIAMGADAGILARGMRDNAAAIRG